jgi:hypothetical protein
MTEPTGQSFSAKLGGPSALRIAIVAGALFVLVTSAALAMAASPDPSSGTSTAPGTDTAPSELQAPMGGNGFMGGDGFIGGPGMGGPFMGGPGMGGPGMGGPGMDGAGMRGPGMRGFGQISITAINDSNLSLKTIDGWTRTITVTSSTKITKGGATIALEDLRVDDEIRFSQTRNSDGTYTIDAIAVVLPRAGGEVTATTGTSITVTQRDGSSATIEVGSSTTYQVAGVTNASLSDVTVGMRVVAEGSKASDGTLTAARVFAAAAGQFDGDHGRMHGWDRQGAPVDPAPNANPSGSADGA